MAWSMRSGRRVYYRCRRVGQRVFRDYYGSQDEARMAYALDQERQLRRLQERADRCLDRERWEEASESLNALIKTTDLLVRAAFVVAGYHQHHMGEWRKRRDYHL